MFDGLPIYNKQQEIIDSIQNNQVTLVVADTGSGKSTQVPKFILDMGGQCVITQPRRLAAISVATRVAEELGQSIGNEIGYSVRGDKCHSPKTKVLFCTDGLGVVKALLQETQFHVLIIDEVHEMNTNIEVLIAWAKLQLKEDPTFRLVLMSATVDVTEIESFFKGMIGVIRSEGRCYPVEDLTETFSRMSTADTLHELIAAEHNILVFKEGKAEIERFISTYSNAQSYPALARARFLPLHGELPYAEQKKCFMDYGRPLVVVATNVAQSSITIPGITAVMTSGKHKATKVVDGVQGLYLEDISKAEMEQQKGRAGRVKPGVFVDRSGNARREDFPVPEIRRTHLDKFYLQILIAGYDPEKLQFLHQPKKKMLEAARELLIRLGCLTEDRQVTPLGRALVKYPLEVRYAKMMYVAAKLGVSDAVLSVVSYLANKMRIEQIPGEADYYVKEDLMLACFFYEIVSQIKPVHYKKYGVSQRNFARYRETIRLCKLQHDLPRDNSFDPQEEDNVIQSRWATIKDRVTLAVVSGMVDLFYRSVGYAGMVPADTYQESQHGLMLIGSRTASNKSRTWNLGQFMAAVPVDIVLEYKTLELLEFIIPFKPQWVEWFPELFQTESKVEHAAWAVDYKQNFKYFPHGRPGEEYLISSDSVARVSIVTEDSYSSRERACEQIEEVIATCGLTRDQVMADYHKAARMGSRSYYDPHTGVRISIGVSPHAPSSMVQSTSTSFSSSKKPWEKLEPQKPYDKTQWTLSNGRVTCPDGHSFKLKSSTVQCICPMCAKYIPVKELNQK